MNPFFSVCVPATDREKTIFQTLLSLSAQTFDDFEVIISLCRGIDNTEAEIHRFLGSPEFLENPFSYKIQKLDYVPKTVEDWNEPLKIATGKYIAMLEGDDQFLPNHLKNAFDFLHTNDRVGLYFPGSNYEKRLLSGSEAFLELYELKAIPAPSEAIFVAADGREQFLYNTEEYNYCPEIELYFTICNKGWNVAYSGIDGVLRDRTMKSRARWKYYRDHFYILNKFRNTNHGTESRYTKAFNEITLRATNALIYNRFTYKIPEARELKDQLIAKVGRLQFYASMLVSFSRIMKTFLRKRLRK